MPANDVYFVSTWALGIAGIVACVGGILLGVDQSLALDRAEDEGVVIPELYYPGDSGAYCVARIDLAGSEQDRRKDVVLNFIERAYEATEHWTKDYALSAIDFADFRFLHVVAFSACDSSRSLLRELSAQLESCDKAKELRCEFDKPELHVGLDIPLVLRRGAVEDRVPISIFEGYRSQDDLRKCTIRLPFKPPLDVQRFVGVVHGLNSLRLKYRMSILDIALLDRDVYFLLARQCDEKRRLFEIMRELLARQGLHISQYFGSPDFTPDVQDYRRSQIGATSLRPK
jgi:hypothetical protein